MAQQELGRSESGPPVDEGGFSSSQCAGAVEAGVQANPGDPARNDPGVLPRCQRPSREALAEEEVVAGLLRADSFM